ncbi:unnamed protein product [Sphenostylis stenocarpa]|uniref:Uncharacterized protein n=1 Tax=Sphenostylis stenocarpa TaxID=92480 RepID=A0AA86RR54_9FABA|nr:unnamed protein product [Sphenostylis stenocarpa]
MDEKSTWWSMARRWCNDDDDDECEVAEENEESKLGWNEMDQHVAQGNEAWSEITRKRCV